MARITVEDCIQELPDPFSLIVLAAHRARQLDRGSEPTVARDRDKQTVVALREIAAATVSPDTLRESLLAGIQRVRPEMDDVVEGDMFTASRLAQEFANESLYTDEYLEDADTAPADGVEPDDRLAMSEPSEEELKALETEMSLGEDAEPQ